MQSQTTPKKNTAIGMIPAVMKWRVKEVKVTNHLSFLATFNDGTKGRVTIKPEWLTGVFSVLKDPEMFKTLFVEHGAVTWPNGLDLDPKSMYDEIKANGQYTIF